MNTYNTQTGQTNVQTKLLGSTTPLCHVDHHKLNCSVNYTFNLANNSITSLEKGSYRWTSKGPVLKIITLAMKQQQQQNN